MLKVATHDFFLFFGFFLSIFAIAENFYFLMPNPQKVVLYHKAQNLLFDFVNSIGIFKLLTSKTINFGKLFLEEKLVKNHE
jgi:hypothetical protein